MTGQTAIWIPYCGAAPVPGELLARWNLDPVLLAGCGVAALLYGRAAPGYRWAFSAATILFFILFVSPFCALSSALFAARVTHHVLLSLAIAPLLVWAFDRVPVKGRIALWTGVQTLVFWAWHAPPAYAFALSSDAAYWLMQASIFGVSFGFWSAVRRASAPAAVGALLAAMVQMGLLGALITFAPAPLYAPHFLTTQAWGLSPLEDQQLAGLIMWAPSAGFYLGAALILLWRWLGRDEPERAQA